MPYGSSVSPKGQITLPIEARRRLGIRPKDRVTIEIHNDSITVRPAKKGSFLDSYRSIPALKTPMSVEEMTEIAAEEAALEAMDLHE
jgi:AbrB family looped-hinge helix DNA binding protein